MFRKVALGLIFCSSVAHGEVSAQTCKDLEGCTYRAFQALKSKNKSEALVFFRRSCQLDPEARSTATCLEVIELEDGGHLPAALRRYDEWCAKGHLEACQRAANVLERLGRNNEAAAKFEPVCRAGARDACAQASRILGKLGQIDHAGQMMEAACGKHVAICEEYANFLVSNNRAATAKAYFEPRCLAPKVSIESCQILRTTYEKSQDQKGLARLGGHLCLNYDYSFCQQAIERVQSDHAELARLLAQIDAKYCEKNDALACSLVGRSAFAANLLEFANSFYRKICTTGRDAGSCRSWGDKLLESGRKQQARDAFEIACEKFGGSPCADFRRLFLEFKGSRKDLVSRFCDPKRFRAWGWDQCSELAEELAANDPKTSMKLQRMACDHGIYRACFAAAREALESKQRQRAARYYETAAKLARSGCETGSFDVCFALSGLATALDRADEANQYHQLGCRAWKMREPSTEEGVSYEDECD